MKSTRRTGPRTIDEYLAGVPPKFRAELARLRRTIQLAAPGAEETISYQMPAFRKNGILVYFAAFKDHLSFFVASSEVRRQLAEELRPFDSGKGTLHFTPAQPLPAGLVSRIVRARVAENAARPRPGSRARPGRDAEARTRSRPKRSRARRAS